MVLNSKILIQCFFLQANVPLDLTLVCTIWLRGIWLKTPKKLNGLNDEHALDIFSQTVENEEWWASVYVGPLIFDKFGMRDEPSRCKKKKRFVILI